MGRETEDLTIQTTALIFLDMYVLSDISLFFCNKTTTDLALNGLGMDTPYEGQTFRTD